jgi:hypothetical protein
MKPPPRIGGLEMEWVRKGAGWDCKLVFRENGSRKRKHLRHLGKKEWARIKESPNVPAAIHQWVVEQRSRKGM